MIGTGYTNGNTLKNMGFCNNATGTIRDTVSFYNLYLWRAQYYQSYQAVYDNFDAGNYYIRNINTNQQLAFEITTGSDVFYLETLDGNNNQVLTIRKGSTGFIISTKKFPNYVLTFNPSTGSVFFGNDDEEASQRWSFIPLDESDGLYIVVNADAPNKNLIALSNQRTLMMDNNVHEWSIREIIYANTMNSILTQRGVVLCYAKDYWNGEDLMEGDDYKKIFGNNYTNYYFDYTTPIFTLLNSKTDFYNQYKVQSLEKYIETLQDYGVIDFSDAIPAWIAQLANSFLAFYQLVRAGAPMDLKIKDCWDEQFNSEIPYIWPWPAPEETSDPPYKMIFAEKFRTSEHIGNITYGYMGTMLGFGEELLYCAGGAAALAGNAGLLSYPEKVTEAYLKGPEAYYGDGANDHFAIKEGIELAKRYNEIEIGYELPENVESLAEFVNSLASIIANLG